MVEAFTLENVHLRMHVDPQGGAVKHLHSIRFRRPVLQAPDNQPSLFPMLPLANRVAGNRFFLQGREVALPQSPRDATFYLHGDGWFKQWQVTSRSPTRCVLQLRSVDPCGFDYVAQLHYQLFDNALHASLTLTHCGPEPMLYGLGFHPWFFFERESSVQFSASGYWPEGENHLPLAWEGELPFHINFHAPQFGRDAWLNVCYSGWSGQAHIRNNGMEITLLSQAPWLMLFRMSGQPFLCLEPQSHPVNAHHMPGQPGLVMLSRGEKTHFSMTILVNSPADKC